MVRGLGAPPRSAKSPQATTAPYREAQRAAPQDLSTYWPHILAAGKFLVRFGPCQLECSWSINDASALRGSVDVGFARVGMGRVCWYELVVLYHAAKCGHRQTRAERYSSTAFSRLGRKSKRRGQTRESSEVTWTNSPSIHVDGAAPPLPRGPLLREGGGRVWRWDGSRAADHARAPLARMQCPHLQPIRTEAISRVRGARGRRASGRMPRDHARMQREEGGGGACAIRVRRLRAPTRRLPRQLRRRPIRLSRREHLRERCVHPVYSLPSNIPPPQQPSRREALRRQASRRSSRRTFSAHSSCAARRGLSGWRSTAVRS